MRWVSSFQQERKNGFGVALDLSWLHDEIEFQGSLGSMDAGAHATPVHAGDRATSYEVEVE